MFSSGWIWTQTVEQLLVSSQSYAQLCMTGFGIETTKRAQLPAGVCPQGNEFTF
jgi:hypothetical protein